MYDAPVICISITAALPLAVVEVYGVLVYVLSNCGPVPAKVELVPLTSIPVLVVWNFCTLS